MSVGLIVLADYETKFITKELEGIVKKRENGFIVRGAEYGQMESVVYDLPYVDGEEKIYVWLSFGNYEAYDFYLAEENRESFAERYFNRISNIWSVLKKKNYNIIQSNFITGVDPVYGYGGASIKDSFVYQIRKLNYILGERISDESTVRILDLDMIGALVGRESFIDDRMYYIAKTPFSLKYIPQVAENVISLIEHLNGRLIKLVITDLDGVLWGNSVGEDGIDKIIIGEGIGGVYLRIQKWMKELKNKGILLAVCSKNDYEVAMLPFTEISDMILNIDDFVMFEANWKNKSDNIFHICRSLNISYDSVVFIDDNPLERAEVKRVYPEMYVPDLPESAEKYLDCINRLNLFSFHMASDNDSIRSKQYMDEVSRSILRQNFKDYNEYLKNLGLKIEAQLWQKKYESRIVQLFQRTNQFNLSNYRYSSKDVEALMKHNNYNYIIRLEDNIGSYGIVSAFCLVKRDNMIIVNDWVLSCRVFHKGVENWILSFLKRIGLQEKCDLLILNYKPSKKNGNMKTFFDEYGFHDLEGVGYAIRLTEMQDIETVIVDK